MKSKSDYYKWIIVLTAIISITANAQNAVNHTSLESQVTQQTLKKKTNTSEEEIITSYFDNGDRIYFLLPTVSGKTIKAYTDTGGGWSMLYPWTIKSLGFEKQVQIDSLSGQHYILAQNVFKNSKFHPFLPKQEEEVFGSPYFSVPSEKLLSSFGKNIKEEQAFFGQFFFINHTWQFDYINQKVSILEHANLSLNDADTQKLGFKKDANGNKLFGHPSMLIRIDGKNLPMLFDTGATFHLSKVAQSQLHQKHQIGGSFIAQSIYQEWRQNHPDWEIIEAGDEVPNGVNVYEMDMIKVPEIQIGNQIVGPVWFSVRPDQAWSKGMIRTMDKVVKGALGGSALKYFKVTVDYPNELIKFEN